MNKVLWLFCLIISGCASQGHLRETIQREHPDCHVFEDLTIECPDPFKDMRDSSAGFGTEVKTVKKPKRKK